VEEGSVFVVGDPVLLAFAAVEPQLATNSISSVAAVLRARRTLRV
jgi:hypothetical protein